MHVYYVIGREGAEGMRSKEEQEEEEEEEEEEEGVRGKSYNLHTDGGEKPREPTGSLGGCHHSASNRDNIGPGASGQVQDHQEHHHDDQGSSRTTFKWFQKV